MTLGNSWIQSQLQRCLSYRLIRFYTMRMRLVECQMIFKFSALQRPTSWRSGRVLNLGKFHSWRGHKFFFFSSPFLRLPSVYIISFAVCRTFPVFNRAVFYFIGSLPLCKVHVVWEFARFVDFRILKVWEYPSYVNKVYDWSTERSCDKPHLSAAI